MHTTTRASDATNPKVPVICLECAKKFQVRANGTTGPVCPKCGSVDIEVRES